MSSSGGRQNYFLEKIVIKMAHFRSAQRSFITFSELMLGDDSENSFFLSMMRKNCILYIRRHLGRRFIPRITGYKDIVDELPNDYFQSHFRISSHVFELILQEVSPTLKRQDSGGYQPVPPRMQLQIFLWYLCNQASMRGVAQLYGVTKSTVYYIVKSVCDALLPLQNRIIRWPDRNRRQDISAAVFDACGLPGVVGFLDGTHIRLRTILGGDNDYINRKGFPSMQLQLTVDHNLAITSAFTGWPGCTHDARVLRNSQLYQRAENGLLFSQNEHLLADNAYPLRNWLISPFKNIGVLTAQQNRFNKKLSSQRQCVERAIGHLKGRFRRLREVTLYRPVDICKLIIAACICHNFCVMCEDDIERYINEGNVDMHPNDYPNIFQNGYHGIARRLRLLNMA